MLAPWAWRVLVIGVVTLAVYVAAGRFLMQQVPSLRDPILAQLNQRLPFAVAVERLQGGWNAFSPELRFHELVLTPRGGSGRPVAIGRGALRLDVPASLMTGSVQFSRLEIDGLSLDARLTDAGVIELEGFRGGGGDAIREWLENFLPNVERVSLARNRLSLKTKNGLMGLELDLILGRVGNDRQLQGMIRGEALTLGINAQGVGNPLRPLTWTGDVFLDARSEDLAGLSELWEHLELPFVLNGGAAAQVWLNRSEGDSQARMRLASEGLLLEERGAAWSLPIEVLRFDAALEQRARRWTLLAQDFHVEREGRALDLERAQFDWSGQALRIRAADLGLDALPALLATAPGLAQGLRDALPDLAPKGYLRSIELRLDDLSAPAQSWQLRSRLEALEVGSWQARKTPALAGVSGYLTLQPGRGELQLDSDQFVMHYPSVYHAPQEYSDALGTLYFFWDSTGLEISSDLLRLQGEEGTAFGLVGIDIPFQQRDTGVELELLIGLKDSRAEFRDKYLPYTLPAPLLRWLGDSVRGGEVERAGFIWRGSTRRGNFPHMTVQLFLDLNQAELAYDPAWPVLEDLQGTVWVDDARSWLRVERASVLGAEAEQVMGFVDARGGKASLHLDGRIHGPAQGAAALFADSALADMTRGVFSGWQFGGDVDGNLRLSLALTNKTAVPDVALDLQLKEARAWIEQVDLQVDKVSGTLAFHTGSGFSGSTLQGNALGGAFSLAADATALPSLGLTLDGDVSSERVAEWLKLPLLNFADGASAVHARITVDEDLGSWLKLESDLTGVAFDAPAPFAKAPDQPLVLGMAVPLTNDPQIDLSVGERLKLRIALREEGLHQLVAAVGGTAPATESCDQRYCLTGAVSSLDLAQWSDFYSSYIAASNAAADSPEADVNAGNAAPAPPFSYRIESLEVGELQLGSRSLGGAKLHLWGVDTLWQGAMESDWVQGSLTREGDDLHLLVEYLDTARFGGDSGSPLKLTDAVALLPSMHVDVLDLRSAERSLGNFSFDLDTQQADGSLYASAIRGELWKLRLDDPAPGMLRWGSDGDGEYTALELDTTFDDFGAVLEAAAFAPTLESERGELSLRLDWPGAPTAFSSLAARGNVTIEARNGRILDNPSGALAMISFLNLAEILRGLSLAHMFEAGIPFQTAQTQLNFRGGSMDIVNMQIDGAASAFAFNGVSDLKGQRVDGDLVVTLPVANNLPWVAALAGGLPVAAGVFVVSKVFEKQVNRMSSAVYRVSGDLDSPEVEFRRLFDDQPTVKKPSPAASAGSETGDG